MLNHPSFKHDKEVLITANNPSVYTDKVAKLAERVFEELEDNKYSTLEHAGRAALGILLDDYANGRMDDNQAHTFLKSLADKKTPQPVQQIEQHVEMDMRVLFSDLIAKSDETQKLALEKADVKKKKIMTRYGLDETLQIPPDALPNPITLDSIATKDDQSAGSVYTPGDEPAEIQEIRRKKEAE